MLFLGWNSLPSTTSSTRPSVSPLPKAAALPFLGPPALFCLTVPNATWHHTFLPDTVSGTLRRLSKHL